MLSLVGFIIGLCCVLSSVSVYSQENDENESAKSELNERRVPFLPLAREPNRLLAEPLDIRELDANRNLVKARKIRTRVDPNQSKNNRFLSSRAEIIEETIIEGKDGSVIIMRKSSGGGNDISTLTYIGRSVNLSDRDSSACSEIGSLEDDVTCQ